MQRSFKRLERVLKLEADQGYKNKAVVGGIRQFVMYWVAQAREEAADETDLAFVEQTAELLLEYGRLPGMEARAKAIQSLLQSLHKRETRIETTQPTPPSRPEETPAAPQKRTTRKQKQQVVAEKKPAAPEPDTEPDTEFIEETAVHSAEDELSSMAPAPQDPSGEPDPVGLAQSVIRLKGVGTKIGKRLEKLGAQTIQELLYVFPRRYDDYTLMKPINQLQYGDQVTIIGTVWETRARHTRNNQVMVQAVVSDGTGSIQANWFNQPWLVEKLRSGMQIVLSGKVDQYLGRLMMPGPEWEALELEPLRTRRIVPVYPLTQGLNSNKMRDIMRTAVSDWSDCVPEPLPQTIRRSQNLYSLPQALYQIHFPDNQQALYEARRRLIFDELFLLQLGMQRKRNEWCSQPGISLQASSDALQMFYDTLPFSLTNAQQRVIAEITADMVRDVPMNRLLQGDVGAGKTIIAAAAMLTAVQAGAQATLMAPTEILAEQHFRGLSYQLQPLGIKTALLTGSIPAAEKEQIYAGLTSGDIQVAIGTHALIQETVAFHKLGLVVIDEQHRFGVDQRSALRNKGVEVENGRPNPHLLVMSATPIPRTLALSLYGDLDLSILDEMPPGRQEIKTHWLQPTERERAYAFVRRQVGEGRQAYIIYPLVEESDKIDAGAAVDEYERLRSEVFPDLRLGLIHGRLRADEKEAAMRAFNEGQTDILVATSVIEVGVDVPNATLIIIEGANRFGLAQLHQFRGRVGRGVHQSYCILVADNSSTEAEERLKALEQTNDGFALAEKDLEIRGPGEFFGRRQSGIPELKLASILDMETLQKARTEAEKVFAADPTLDQPKHQFLKERIAQFWEHAGDIS